MVEVNQADRDAAADLLLMAEGLKPEGNDAAAVRNGRWDECSDNLGAFVQRVIEYRLAAEQVSSKAENEALQARVTELADEFELLVTRGGVVGGSAPVPVMMCERILAALRQRPDDAMVEALKLPRGPLSDRSRSNRRMEPAMIASWRFWALGYYRTKDCVVVGLGPFRLCFSSRKKEEGNRNEVQKYGRRRGSELPAEEGSLFQADSDELSNG